MANFKIHKKQNLMECKVALVEISKLIENEEFAEKTGIKNHQANPVFCKPKDMVINLSNSGGVAAFYPDKTELELDEDGDEGMLVDGTFVEFGNGTNCFALVEFDKFKKEYFDYLEIEDGKES